MPYTGETCVLSWGEGAVSGHDSREDQPRVLEIFDQARVVSVSCSSRFSLALTASGQVWRWGSDTLADFVPKPYKVPNLEGIFITKIACTTPGGDYGISHCACISDKLDLYMWGSNRSFQLALPEDIPSKEAPFKIHEKVSDVACGDTHSVAIIDGDVYCWGDQYGQKPTAVLTGQHVTKVEAGGFGFCGALAKDHTLHTWCLSHGVSEGDFLGHGARYQPGCSTPKPVPSLVRNVKYFACGWIHAAAVTLNGDLYTWGEGDTNRLGHLNATSASRHKHAPTLVSGMEGTNVTRLALSRGNEAALTESGDIYAWGGSDHGGHHLHPVPTLLPLSCTLYQDVTVREVSCGKSHTVIVLNMNSSLKYLCFIAIAKHIDDFMPVLPDLPTEMKEGIASVLNDRRKLTKSIVEKLEVDIKPIEVVKPSLSLRQRLRNFLFGRSNEDDDSEAGDEDDYVPLDDPIVFNADAEYSDDEDDEPDGDQDNEDEGDDMMAVG